MVCIPAGDGHAGQRHRGTDGVKVQPSVPLLLHQLRRAHRRCANKQLIHNEGTDLSRLFVCRSLCNLCPGGLLGCGIGCALAPPSHRRLLDLRFGCCACAGRSSRSAVSSAKGL